jgi:hypothetical protein
LQGWESLQRWLADDRRGGTHHPCQYRAIATFTTDQIHAVVRKQTEESVNPQHEATGINRTHERVAKPFAGRQSVSRQLAVATTQTNRSPERSPACHSGHMCPTGSPDRTASISIYGVEAFGLFDGVGPDASPREPRLFIMGDPLPVRLSRSGLPSKRHVTHGGPRRYAT